jgi:hypothetical protein
VAAELWRIATGDGSESARVSALRTLADIFGMLRAAPPELPEGLTILLDALYNGLGPHPSGQGVAPGSGKETCLTADAFALDGRPSATLRADSRVDRGAGPLQPAGGHPGDAGTE